MEMSSTPRFTHYRWQAGAGGRTFTVEFRLTDADLPANNNKDAPKKFNLLVADKVEWQEDKAALILPFHSRGLTPAEESQLAGTQEAKLRESIIARTVKTLDEHPTVTGVQHLALAMMAPKRDAARRELRDKNGSPVPLLQHHLSRWAVKNESDFFIHKDLRRFLSGELDYFLKSVVLNLDNLLAAGQQRVQPNLRLLDAVKRLGTEIIDFVSQLENFQKSLFEKKKFVLETSWCLTLDRIPAGVKEEVYDAILANDRQWEEWETLFKISKWPHDLVSPRPRRREFLDAHPHLMVDTGLRNAAGPLAYDPALAERIIAGIEALDSGADGTIIHSENFQALSLIAPRYRSSIKCAYIDPPYNTGDDANFSYKDSYQRSTWLAFLETRLTLARSLLTADGHLASHTDENESDVLRILLNAVFGAEANLGTVVWDKRNPKEDARSISA
jgi:adenine-specific DNA-methyltransferase